MNHNGNANKMVDTPRTDAVARINEYLGVGGLFNPEILNVQQHESVRDTLIQARDELNAANQRIKELEKATQERDKEWFQVIESILGFHPVSMTEALRIGIERIKKHKQLIKRLKEAGDAMASEPLEYTYEHWLRVRGSKP